MMDGWPFRGHYHCLSYLSGGEAEARWQKPEIITQAHVWARHKHQASSGPPQPYCKYLFLSFKRSYWTMMACFLSGCLEMCLTWTVRGCLQCIFLMELQSCMDFTWLSQGHQSLVICVALRSYLEIQVIAKIKKILAFYKRRKVC